jgi:hypothetical protein
MNTSARVDAYRSRPAAELQKGKGGYDFDREHEKLAAIYVQRGVDPSLAKQVAVSAKKG